MDIISFVSEKKDNLCNFLLQQPDTRNYQNEINKLRSLSPTLFITLYQTKMKGKSSDEVLTSLASELNIPKNDIHSATKSRLVRYFHMFNDVL